ncbi:MAG: 6-carboxytetrahydropterin synthase, partial [Candidatus Latescibacterota bacterium]
PPSTASRWSTACWPGRDQGMSMPRTQAVRRIQFCAGHRVLGHEGKCAHVHGHNYVAFFHAAAEGLDAVGRIIDFGVLKARLGGWVDEHWDHGFVYYREDRELARLFEGELAAHKHFALPCNPTAENLARYLLEEVGPGQLAGTGTRLVRVVLWETENCFAEVSLE